MKIINVEQNTDAWLEARKGKITGSKLKDIIVKRGTGKKLGFYELIAERLSLGSDGEDAMERGHRLEQEAIDLFAETTGKQVEQVGLCEHDVYPDIALSPDGLIKIDGKYKEAIEVKCLSASRHLQAHFEQAIPNEYHEQILQYFIVNEDLETLHFVFYDPRIQAKPFVMIDVKREHVADELKECLDYQIKTIEEMNTLLNQLTF